LRRRSTERPREGGRFLPLLIALVVLFLLYPVMVELDLASLYRLGFIAFLIVALWSLSRDRRVLIVALVLGVPTIVGQFGIFAAPTPAVLLGTSGLALLFLTFTTLVILLGVLRPGEVTGDKLAGAICVYLMLGLTFAILFSLLEVMRPGAFQLPGALSAPELGHGGEYVFIYFSFSTLTTLGFGDIVPAAAFARTLTWMEAAAGQLYLAILIARLVGLHLIHRQTDS
jgi:voltage-gated potassium channel